jgi:hypothetical protein
VFRHELPAAAIVAASFAIAQASGMRSLPLDAHLKFLIIK